MIGKTYGINWLEVIRRILGIALFWGLSALFVWFVSGRDLGLNWETIASILFALLCLGVGLWLLQSVLITLWQNPRISLSESGVTFASRERQMEWDWDEFTHWSGKMTFQKMYGIITMYISGECTFYSADKPVLSVNGLCADAPLVAGRIILQTIKLQVAKQVADFQRGETLQFSKITLNKEGLREGSTLIPFEDITGASINQYYLWIFRKSQPKPNRLTVAESSHAPELLVEIINRLVQSPTQ